MTTACWTSIHAFFAPPVDWHDLVRAVTQELDAAGGDAREDWFFVRYYEAGPHVRVRLGPRARGALEAVTERLATELARPVPADLDPSRWQDAGYPGSDGSRIAPGTLIEQPYEPELQRYGGSDALVVTEQLFRRSTSLAAAILARWPGNPAAWRNQALDMMLAASAVACPPGWDRGRFFNGYADFWSDYLDTVPAPDRHDGATAARVLARLAEHDRFAAAALAPRTPAQSWIAALRQARAALEALAAEGRLRSPETGGIVGGGGETAQAVILILASQMHMMNNRLGVFPREEMRWCAAIARDWASARERSHE